MNDSPQDDAHSRIEVNGNAMNDYHGSSECADDLEYVNGVRVPVVEVERVHYKDFDVLRWFCVICDTFHEQAPNAGYAQANCFIPESPYLQTGVDVVGPAALAKHRPIGSTAEPIRRSGAPLFSM